MGAKNASKYDKLFEGLVKLIKKRQQELEILLEEREMLEDRIKTQHGRWVSDVRLCKDHISQLNDALVEKDKEISLLSVKSAFMVGLKEREASTLKLKLEQTEDELTDFKALFEYPSHVLEKNSIETDKEKEEGSQSNLTSGASKRLVNEVKRLKLENEKLSSEKDFIWNQYNVLESDLTDKLKRKESELKLANNKIAKVLSSAEKLQLSNDHKDEMVGSLKSKLAESEVDRDKLKEEVSRLTNELKSIEESKNTPVLRRHKHGDTEAKRPTRGTNSSLSKGRSITVLKEIPSGKSSAPLKDGEKGSRSSKRKVVEEVCVLETPKLFSNSFKVPKLKTPPFPVT